MTRSDAGSSETLHQGQPQCRLCSGSGDPLHQSTECIRRAACAADRHLCHGQYRRNAPRPRRTLYIGKLRQPHTQHFAVQKQQGPERLVVGGHGDVALGGQHGQQLLNLCGTHVTRMPHLPATPMPTHEKLHPVQASFFSAQAIVFVPQYRAQLIQQAG